MIGSQASFELLLFALVLTVPLLVGLVAYLLLPGSLREIACSNSTRYDGSFSRRRRNRERQGLLEYLLSVTTVPVLALLPLAIGVVLMHQWVVPVDLAFTALERYDSDAEKWKANLRDTLEGDIQKEHQTVVEESGLSPEVAKTIQHSLWNSWPIVIAVGLFAMIGCMALTARIYVRAIREYHDGVIARSREYYEVDLARIAHESSTTEFA